MKSYKECPPPPSGKTSFTTGKPALTEYSPSKKSTPPDPPPMRGGRQQHFDIEGVAIFIIISMAVGIACGWQMHGGICS